MPISRMQSSVMFWQSLMIGKYVNGFAFCWQHLKRRFTSSSFDEINVQESTPGPRPRSGQSCKGLSAFHPGDPQHCFALSS